MTEKTDAERWGAVTTQLESLVKAQDATRNEIHTMREQMTAQHAALSAKLSAESKDLHGRIERASERAGEQFESKENAKSRHSAIVRDLGNIRSFLWKAVLLTAGAIGSLAGWIIYKG